ncbi:Transcription initiation factor TFIID subunit [Lachnellula subtilissima]|uniref:Transcription initiation factor TFIID subunit n=1 Tax=Lachnellula subtilissima TaxID=602034 RepID=A0A8H8UFL7_9HELO|nr:Transcription initiation factor TFIID subunit [Lachnellula subtilissima]
MASPPYNHNYTSAISPPYPSNAQLPQPPKRRQSDMPSSAPAQKRRKASMLSTTSAASAHPLRQTSFPPENASHTTPAFSRSPTSDTMSLVSGSGAKKKRARKPKKGENDKSSVVGGEGKRKRRASTAEEEEDDGGGNMDVQMASGTLEERKKEMEHRALLTSNLDAQQFSRFEAWRSSKLPDAIVRRIINQTLSQSAPTNVILAVKSAAKVFAGEMIEGARKVQTQWLESSGEDQTTGLQSLPAEDGKPREKETRRGPLLPDHLREALRRHKLTRDGGLVGQLGLWQHQQSSGVERFGTKVGGKRLFK